MIKVGDRIRSLEGTGKVVALKESRVQVLRLSTGDREWLDVADFNVAWKPEQRSAR